MCSLALLFLRLVRSSFVLLNSQRVQHDLVLRHFLLSRLLVLAYIPTPCVTLRASMSSNPNCAGTSRPHWQFFSLKALEKSCFVQGMLPATLQPPPTPPAPCLRLCRTRLPQQCVAELLGTALMVMVFRICCPIPTNVRRTQAWSTRMQIGCASVSAEVVSKATHGVFQVAAVWGLVVIISISLFGRISGAHFNPAISLAMAIWRPDAFSARSQLAPYIISQFVGALLGASITIAASYSSLLSFEDLNPTLARSTGDDAWSHTQRSPKFKVGFPPHGSVPSTCAPRLVCIVRSAR